MSEQKTLLDGLDRLSKRRLSDAIAKGLRRYSAKIRVTRKHFTEGQPYTEPFSLNGKTYTLAIHTDNKQMVTWVIHDPVTRKLIITA